MAKVKQVLRHVSVETAKRQRKCYRNPLGHVIAKGDSCLVEKEGGGSRNYCAECAEPILDKAQEDLDLLRVQLHL